MGNASEHPYVFVLDPYHESALSKLKENNDLKLVLPEDSCLPEWMKMATAVLVRSETQLSAEILAEASPNLKYIVKQGVGVDNIDLSAAQTKGIKVFNTPALNSETVAELTIALAFCISRRICEMDRLIRGGSRVIRSKMLGKSLFQKTLGVVGMGNIGVEVARKWIGAMSGQVVAFDSFAPKSAWSDVVPQDAFRRAQALEELLRVADVVSLHVPLTRSTQGLIGQEQLAIMKEGSILLNCSRGGVVDEVALLDALKSDHLYGAGLDAVLHEPPSLASYGETLLSHPRVVVTPHIGASTEENQEISGLAAVGILFDLLAGGPAAEGHRPLN